MREQLGERVHHVRDIFEARTPDEVHLAYAGERSWAVICRDHQILKRAHERAILQEHRMVAFFLRDENAEFCWIVRAMIRHWPEIKRLAGAAQGPSLFLIGERRVTPLQKRHLRK
jgi:hypothetical protein